MMISTGDRKTGRLAGGAPEPHTYKGSVFGSRSAILNPVHGNRPGGLIDKRQQVDPSSTTFGHPFDGGGYRSTSTQHKLEPKTGFNLIHQVNPLKQNVPEVQPNARGNFFSKRGPRPIIRTVGGATSGKNFSSSAVKLSTQITIKSTQSTEKIINKEKTPSFESNANLWGKDNHSFLKNVRNPISGTVGVGRWQTEKRSAV
jgi:hypothetical protein